ncbi:hypothetical protein GUITHDRAFT_109998 [Guillardia theta CCMP2712]|uniref:PDZ domain-containing protein n=1 Tax=Guillardia theta (strain CCMP2712) TaxID=905079 RepID=L1J6Q8_GUITC|nr:hypothetical protein GUITHDRAFT_109998 [Guillardia theta CCMP2712]EKX44211.1 hypothetical protein GUITHDRAFT_109998 [Guillardia theta CCMP2712]|eukprot:XP_005831191.1 hypothetical protein GUITHDRAFT_109998 [Guillardia theta CCMP2712]
MQRRVRLLRHVGSGQMERMASSSSPSAFSPTDTDGAHAAGSSGVGLKCKVSGGQVVIIDVEQNSSAQEAGLCVGDLLVEVDGKATRTMSGQELAAAIRGPEGTSVELLLQVEDTSLHATIKAEEMKFDHEQQSSDENVKKISLKRKWMSGCRSFEGDVGLVLSRAGESLVIVDVAPGSPAEACMQQGESLVGHRLTAVDDHEVTGHQETLKQLRGVAGTEIHITVDTSIHDDLPQYTSMFLDVSCSFQRADLTSRPAGSNVAPTSPANDLFACIQMAARRRNVTGSSHSHFQFKVWVLAADTRLSDFEEVQDFVCNYCETSGKYTRMQQFEDSLPSSPQLYLNSAMTPRSTNEEGHPEQSQSRQVFQRILHLKMTEDEDRSHLQVTEKLWEEIVIDQHVNLLVCVRAVATGGDQRAVGQTLLKMKPSSTTDVQMKLQAESGKIVEKVDISLTISTCQINNISTHIFEYSVHLPSELSLSYIQAKRESLHNEIISNLQTNWIQIQILSGSGDDKYHRLRSIISLNVNEDLHEDKMVDEMLRQILEENVNFSSIQRQDEKIGMKHFSVLVRSTPQEPLRPSQDDVAGLVGELHEVCSSIAAALEAMAIKLSDLRPYRPLRPHDSNPMSSWAPADCMQRVDLMDSQDRHELPSRTVRRRSEELEDTFESLSPDQLRNVLRMEKENRILLMHDMNRLSEIYEAKHARMRQANDEKDELIRRLKEKLQLVQAGEIQVEPQAGRLVVKPELCNESTQTVLLQEPSSSSLSTSKSDVAGELDRNSRSPDSHHSQRSSTNSVMSQVYTRKQKKRDELTLDSQLETSMKLEYNIRRSNSLRLELLNAIDSAQRVMKTFHL